MTSRRRGWPGARVRSTNARIRPITRPTVRRRPARRSRPRGRGSARGGRPRRSPRPSEHAPDLGIVGDALPEVPLASSRPPSRGPGRCGRRPPARIPRAVSSSSSGPEKTRPRVGLQVAAHPRPSSTVMPRTMSVKRRSMWSRARKLSGTITRSTEEWLMSRSCQSATFSRAASAFARTQAREARRPARTPPGCACGAWPRSPSGRLPNGSSTSRTSVFCRARTSVANVSRLAAMMARVVRTSAWRSRCRTWDATGAAARPRRAQTASSTSGGEVRERPHRSRELPHRDRRPGSARACGSAAPAARARGPASGRRSWAPRGRRACARSWARACSWNARSRTAAIRRQARSSRIRSQASRISTRAPCPRRRRT